MEIEIFFFHNDPKQTSLALIFYISFGRNICLKTTKMNVTRSDRPIRPSQNAGMLHQTQMKRDICVIMENSELKEQI